MLRQPFRLTPLAACVACLFLTAHAAAQDAAAPSATVLAQADTAKPLPAVTVTATMTEQDARTAPASVTVITADELAKKNAADLLDAVRQAPGVTLTGRQVGGRKTMALRGLEGKHTLTLIDGRRISASDDVIGHSDYQYGWLPISAIERVEIIRGPMSALYGSEALGGVVHLISKKPSDRWSGSLGLGGSVPLESDSAAHEARTSLYASGPLGDRVRLSVQAERAYRQPVANLDDPSISEIEGNRPQNLGVNAQWQLTPGHEIEGGLVDGQEERHANERGYTPRPYANRYDLDRKQAHIGWKADWGTWRSQLRAYRSEIDIRNSRSNGVTPTRPQNMQDDVVDGHASTRWGAHQITLGGEWRKENLVNAGLKNGADDATHKALFVQDEFALTPNLLATLGLRTDHHALFGSETSPRAYLVWEASPALVVKGGWGHAFKAPTLKQISPNYVGAEGPHSFLGNANIKPESSNSFEIGADWQAAERLSLRGTFFHTEVKDLITYKLLRQIGSRRVYQYDNVDAARIQGLELGATWNISSALQWSTDATLLRTRDKSTGKDLADRPDTSLASRLNWRLGAWQTLLGLEYTSSQTATGGAALPSYTLWNLSTGRAWTLGEGRSLHLRTGIDNLANVRLADKTTDFGYAEQGRRLFVNARLDF
ncbi:TonB-dependent receptor [Acidovorax sp. HDW3]|uniref:TonB-dependent receptor plug domain-containing protein n=1 Tax=Acidovorax sp. HDW3 TaxID=2714923 RepID=UPI001408121C|nr:TonB-dependent receptor [Acidovorax sp. HDW3]QIL45265.1 TonB-dependent receptor [Acidovorax sp. HDW3]